MRTDDVARSIGTDTRIEWCAVRCGPLAMHFDPTIGALRNIRLGDQEVVRAISVAVRDRNWGTVAPQIAEINLTVAHGGFRLAFVAVCREREIDFRWQGHIVGEPNGSLRFDMDGEAQSTFWRNRIGFCILHPIRECAGAPCFVTTADGAAQQDVFPDLIAPHQPFLNMRGIRHEVLPGVWAELSFDGDLFEMEDQRNWTDASYKTYCTPLSLPYPVEVPQGTRIAQSVTLTLTGDLSSCLAAPEKQDKPITLRLTDSPPMPFPQIGFGIASHGSPLSDSAKQRLQWGICSHLRFDLNLAAPNWEAQLQQAIRDSYAVRVRLEIALFLADDGIEDQLAALVDVLERSRPGPSLARWLIFPTDPKATTPGHYVRAARKALTRFGYPQFGGGTNAYFAELNRSRPPKDALDFICWSINPQVHAFDTASILENLEAQAETIRSARAIYGDLPLVISPVTLKPRSNPNATATEAPPNPDELPPQVDERQCTLIGAAWTLISLKHLFESGVQSVTYYETTGWRGVMETDEGTPMPDKFASTPGALFPLYEIFYGLREFSAEAHVLRLESSAPSKVDGLALREIDYAVLCANLTADTQTVRLLLPPHITRAWVHQADAQKHRLFALPPDYREYDLGNIVRVHNGVLEWELPPYAFARVDWPEQDLDLSEVGDE